MNDHGATDSDFEVCGHVHKLPCALELRLYEIKLTVSCLDYARILGHIGLGCKEGRLSAWTSGYEVSTDTLARCIRYNRKENKSELDNVLDSRDRERELRSCSLIVGSNRPDLSNLMGVTSLNCSSKPA